MLKSILMSFVFLAGAAAHAETMQSEFFFQTEAGKSDLTPKIGYRTFTYKLDGQTSDAKVSGLAMTGLSYEYGINEMFAIEGALYYSSLETDTDPKAKMNGLQNPEITLKGTSGMEFGRLRYGAILSLGFEKRKDPTASSDGNMATGGYELKPYVGADMDAGGGIVGARLSYNFKMERTIDATPEEKRKEGNELGVSAFYEYFFADMPIGGAINYVSEAATKDGDGNEVEESGGKTGISLYTRMPMGTWALIPRLDYDFSKSHYDKYEDMTFTVAARFGF